MAPTEPTPATWTIRFRYHRTTVILHLDPLQNITSIKSELLSALRQTCADGKLSNSIDLPDSASDVLLARPVDINDPSAGWKELQISSVNGALGKAKSVKVKGKAREGSDAEGIDAESLKSLGIKDNALLAFSFQSARAALAQGGRGTGKKAKVTETREENGIGDIAMDGEEGEEAHETWDVVMPSWEDQYGVLNHGDAGALKGFEG